MNRFKPFIAIFFYIFDLAVLLTAKRVRGRNVCVIVKLDAIGDFVLWLPYGNRLIQHLKEKYDEVVLVCNASVEELANSELSADKVLPIQRSRFIHDLRYRAVMLRKVSSLGSVVVYHPARSHDLVAADSLVRACGGVLQRGNKLLNLSHKSITNRWRSFDDMGRTLPTHELVWNRKYLESFGIDFHPGLVSIFTKISPRLNRDTDYYVIAPGASWSGRKWPKKRFIEVALRIKRDWPEIKCFVVGNADERAEAEEIVKAVGSNAENRAGTTELLEYVNLIVNAKFVLGNESSGAHIAAATNVPSFTILGGGHFGRFMPYDSQMLEGRREPIAIFKTMPCFNCNWRCQFSVANGAPVPCIEGVSVDAVWVEVEKNLKNQV